MYKRSDLNFSPKPPASGYMTMQRDAFRVGGEIFLPGLAQLLQYDIHSIKSSEQEIQYCFFET